ncbi:MAG: hypothetical protein N3G75_06270 [Methanothrix sp.]|nr:hypothetical protein [Methanothrix sp.]
MVDVKLKPASQQRVGRITLAGGVIDDIQRTISTLQSTLSTLQTNLNTGWSL